MRGHYVRWTLAQEELYEVIWGPIMEDPRETNIVPFEHACLLELLEDFCRSESQKVSSRLRARYVNPPLHVHADEDVENVETVEWCRYVGDVFYDSLFGHRQLSAGS